MPGRAEPTANPTRIASVDLLRGIVMIIMALDHVRDYFGIASFVPEDLSQSGTAYFFTRWITHFCAPVFVLLSGTSAWLYQSNHGVSNAGLSRFLITRGLWLIVVEATFITIFWQFSYSFVILQIIWAIGCSMIVLGWLVFLPRTLILAIGIAMIVLHNGMLDGIEASSFGDFAWLWHMLHVQGYVPLPDGLLLDGVFFAYPLIPWIGVMAVGYGIAPLLQRPAAERNRLLVVLGATLIATFLVLRGFNIYGESGTKWADAVWQDHGRGPWVAFMSFLNVSKYPPSLLFLCMTLGPMLVLLPYLENWRSTLANIVSVFGRVPFLFYMLHIPFIHALSSIWLRLSFGVWDVNFFKVDAWPAGYTPSLTRVYFVWVLVVVLLYFPCKRFMDYRRANKQWWLSYI